MARMKQWTKFDGERYEGVGISDDLGSRKLAREYRKAGFLTYRKKISAKKYAFYVRRK